MFTAKFLLVVSIILPTPFEDVLAEVDSFEDCAALMVAHADERYDSMSCEKIEIFE